MLRLNRLRFGLLHEYALVLLGPFGLGPVCFIHSPELLLNFRFIILFHLFECVRG